MNIDKFDAKLLNMIQENAKHSYEYMAEKVGLSASAVHRRLSKLKANGIIKSEIAVLSPSAIGNSLTAIIRVSVERENPELLAKFKNAMKVRPEIMQCYYVTGDTDFVVIATVRDLKHFEELTGEVFAKHPNVRRSSTNFVVDPVKVGLSIPVESGVASGSRN